MSNRVSLRAAACSLEKLNNPEDALAVARRAVELGFSNSLGIIHDGSGQLKPLSEREARIYEELKRFGKKSWTRLNRFQGDLAYGRPHDWRRRAGARYLYIPKSHAPRCVPSPAFNRSL